MTSLLLVGDIHLGRAPWRLGGLGLDLARLGPAEAWRRAVDRALGERVEAVVLAGDVVDQDRDRFEAYGLLEQGVARLADAGILVLGVCGNHDGVALPRLAARLPGFRLVGAGGRWERRAVRGVDLLGWSFPGRQHRGDPLLAPGLADALAERREGAALLGVLHTDLDATSSPYAPTRRRDLTALPVDRWFLGHVHQPSDLAAGDRCGYLGSLVGLDPAETGRRGAWLVAAAGPGQVAAEPVSLGPVCWLSLDVDVSDLSLGDAAEDDLHQALERAFRRAQAADPALAAGDLEAVGVSVRWTGRCARRDALVGFEGLIRDAGRALHVGAQVWAAVDFADATRPAHDLPSLAREVTPAGALAALLLDLDERGEVAIPAPVRRRFAEQAAAPWGLVDGAAPPPDLLALTRRAALEALDALLAQREA